MLEHLHKYQTLYKKCQHQDKYYLLLHLYHIHIQTNARPKAYGKEGAIGKLSVLTVAVVVVGHIMLPCGIAEANPIRQTPPQPHRPYTKPVTALMPQCPS